MLIGIRSDWFAFNDGAFDKATKDANVTIVDNQLSADAISPRGIVLPDSAAPYAAKCFMQAATLYLLSRTPTSPKLFVLEIKIQQVYKGKYYDIKLLVYFPRNFPDSPPELFLKSADFVKLYTDVKNDTTFSELRKIRCKRCIMDTFEFKGKYPGLEVVKISNSIFRLDKQAELNGSLKYVTLKNCSLTNSSSKKLLDFLSTSSSKESIERLNFQNNKITKLDFDFELLPHLRELNLENNKLYKLGQFKTPESSLKLLNIIGNNYAFYDNFSDLIEQKNQKNKFIVLCSKNLIAFQDDFKKKYLEKLRKNLKEIEYNISFLSFEMLFNKFDAGNILSLEFNPKIEEGLTYLNLSYCGLTDELMSEFLGKTKLANLRKLNLSSNLLSDKFATDLCNLKNPFFNLKKIVLTNNEKIEGVGHLQSYLQFFEKHHLLKAIQIYRTKFEDNFINFCSPKKREAGIQANYVPPEDATEELFNNNLNYFIQKFNEMFSNRPLKIYIKSMFHAPNQMKQFETNFPAATKVFQFKVSRKTAE